MGVRFDTSSLEGPAICGAQIRERINGILVMTDKPKTEEHIKVDTDACIACKLCYELCPAGAYELTADGKADWSQFGMAYCGECGLCRYICPVDAITWSYPQGGTGKIHKWC